MFHLIFPLNERKMLSYNLRQNLIPLNFLREFYSNFFGVKQYYARRFQYNHHILWICTYVRVTAN